MDKVEEVRLLRHSLGDVPNVVVSVRVLAAVSLYVRRLLEASPDGRALIAPPLITGH